MIVRPDDFRRVHTATTPPPGLTVAERGDAILDAPTTIPAVWGKDRHVLWSRGEMMLLVGQPGVGKSTVAQQIVLRAITVTKEPLFGLPVTELGRVLYVAADRYDQIKRSMRRMVDAGHRDTLRDRLILVKELPEAPTGSEAAARIARWAVEWNADAIVIDSLFNVLPKVDVKTVPGFLETSSALLAAGLEVLVLHHTRKATAENRNPRTLSDVDGAGALGRAPGSVLLLAGDPGAEDVEGIHLKQPGETVGPLEIAHDHERGRSLAAIRPTLQEALDRFGPVTLETLAFECFGNVRDGTLRRTRAALERLVDRGRADSVGDGESELFMCREAAP